MEQWLAYAKSISSVHCNPILNQFSKFAQTIQTESAIMMMPAKMHDPMQIQVGGKNFVLYQNIITWFDCNLQKFADIHNFSTHTLKFPSEKWSHADCLDIQDANYMLICLSEFILPGYKPTAQNWKNEKHRKCVLYLKRFWLERLNECSCNDI